MRTDLGALRHHHQPLPRHCRVSGFAALAGTLVLSAPGALCYPRSPTPAAVEHGQEARIPDSALVVSLPLDSQISTQAADLVFDQPAPLPSPLMAADLRSTDLTPQPLPQPVPERQRSSETPEQTAKDVENPVVNRVSIPIANRTAFGIGSLERTANVTTIAPVLPISLGKNYLLVRSVLPLVYAPTLNQPQGGTFGLGDVREQVYFVPKPTGKLAWGIGPTFLLPTASDRRLGLSQWGIGPVLAVVWTGGRWTVGGRIEQYWSVAGEKERPNVSQLAVQPLVTYILGKGWYLVSAPIIAAVWNRPGEKWVIPIGGGVGKVMTLGTFPFNLSVQAYWQPVRPDNSEGWALVVQAQSLFPRR